MFCLSCHVKCTLQHLAACVAVLPQRFGRRCWRAKEQRAEARAVLGQAAAAAVRAAASATAAAIDWGAAPRAALRSLRPAGVACKPPMPSVMHAAAALALRHVARCTLPRDRRGTAG